MINSYQNSIIAQLLEAITGQINFTGAPTSNIGDILLSILEQTPYDKEPKSVLAELFLKLKDKLEGRAFTPYDKEPKSAIAEILLSILNETEYDKEPNSRISELLLELKAELESYAEITTSGVIANFTTSLIKPLVNLTADIDANENGVNAINIYHLGANLLDVTPLIDDNYYSLNADVSLKVLQTDNRSWNGVTVCGWLKKGTYTLVRSVAKGFCDIRNSIDNYSTGNVMGNNQTSKTFILSEDAYIKIKLGYGLSAENYPFDCFLSLNVGSSPLSYEPYKNTIKTINLGNTYYNGATLAQDKYGNITLTADGQTIDLPKGDPIVAFEGINNIYNDSGDTSVTYLAKIEDNLNATAKFRAEEKAQKEKAKEEEKEIIKEEPIEEIKEPIKDSGEVKKGANKA